MKHLFILFSAALCLLIACNNDKKPGEITVISEDGKTTAKADAGESCTVGWSNAKKAEELQKLSPYTLDQMKAFLPEELAGTKRSKFSANSVMGAAYAEGEYEINDSTKVELKLFDCAGPSGIGIYNSQFLTMWNLQSETDEEYSKTIDFSGTRAIGQVRKDGSRATLISTK